MRYIIMFFLLIFLFSCKSFHKNTTKDRNSLYEINKIDSINNWYIIYGKKNDSIYKILSQKMKKPSDLCEKIKVGNKYKLYLHSRNENPPTINGIKLQPQNYLDVNCYFFDEKTQICIEPEKGIYKLYFTTELQGLCCPAAQGL